MNLALMQAYRNLGNTKENPSVGCVIVNKGNLVGAGSTSIYGRPHAEQNAIKSCKKNVNKCIHQKNVKLYYSKALLAE